MYRIRHVTQATIAALVIAGGLVACGDDPDDLPSNDASCDTILSSVTSPGPGILTLTGSFFDTESVIVRDASDNSLVASGTPATDRDSFTFTGIASGNHTYMFIASCDSGEETIGTKTVTVK